MIITNPANPKVDLISKDIYKLFKSTSTIDFSMDKNYDIPIKNAGSALSSIAL